MFAKGMETGMSFAFHVSKMKDAGIIFADGLSKEELEKIETVYGVKIPASLRAFYETALPIAPGNDEFPRWNDFSDENIAAVRERMEAPYRWLKRDMEKGFCPPAWKDVNIESLFKDAPKLIPIYSHRYMPAIDHPDPPILSTVGQDSIWYGATLEQYLKYEFLSDGSFSSDKPNVYVPIWSDVIGECSWYPD